MRHRYVEALRKYVNHIQESRHIGDVREVERQFEQDMGDSLRQLRQEVKSAQVKMVTSNEFWVGVVLAGSIVTAVQNPSTVTGAAIALPALMGLANIRSQRQERQQQALERQSMSWLYRAERTGRRQL
jgi:hypothetical protein